MLNLIFVLFSGKYVYFSDSDLVLALDSRIHDRQAREFLKRERRKMWSNKHDKILYCDPVIYNPPPLPSSKVNVLSFFFILKVYHRKPPPFFFFAKASRDLYLQVLNHAGLTSFLPNLNHQDNHVPNSFLIGRS